MSNNTIISALESIPQPQEDFGEYVTRTVEKSDLDIIAMFGMSMEDKDEAAQVAFVRAHPDIETHFNAVVEDYALAEEPGGLNQRDQWPQIAQHLRNLATAIRDHNCQL